MAANPAFVLNTYQDQHLAGRLISQIRRYYPDSWIGCISDGDHPIQPGLRTIAWANQVELVEGDRLKLTHHGAAWLRRYLTLAAGKGDPIVKLDPDAFMWRKFGHFLDADISGTYTCLLNQKLPLIRGGCMAYSAQAVESILHSGLLEDPCYRNPYLFGYYPYSAEPSEAHGQLIWSENTAVMHIAKRLKLYLADWSEVRIAFREGVPDNSGLTWAVTHPHKEEKAHV